MLRILLLGSPAIFENDQLLDIKRRVPRALLFYLACHEDPVGREELINLLWPDIAESLGRSNLRDALAKLRSQLPDPQMLIGDHDRVGLNYQIVSSDVLELEQVFQKYRWTILQTPANAPLPRAVYQQLRDAVKRWRSPAFMAGISLPDSGAYDTWVSDTGVRLEQISSRIMNCLAEHQAAAGDFEMAVQWIRANLEFDPLNEELNYRLIAWLNEAGRRSTALQEYNLLRKRLKRENLPLSPAIERLYLKIQDRPFTELPGASPVWPGSLSLQYPMVGQSQVIQALRQAFRRGQVVVLRGEAGSGKTRLAYVLNRSLDSAARLLYCPTRSQEYRSAFQPLIDMLRNSVRPDEWSALAPVWTTALARILPELAQDSSRLPSPPEDAALNEAIYNLFQVLGRSRRLLLILDGAQWCDEDTFKALAYLINRNFFLNHGLLLITIRPEEINPAFTAFLNSLQNSFSIPQYSLEPLTKEEVEQLAQIVVGQPLPGDLATRLVCETMGNPFFLLEKLRTLLEAFPDPEQWENVTSLPVSERIQAIFRQRMARLAPNAVQVFTAMAVHPEPLPPDLIEALADLTPEAVAQALEALEQACLVKPVQDPRNEPAYVIAYDVLRNACLLTLSQARRRILHLRAARALAERNGVTPASAQHLEDGGDLRQAFEAWLTVGKQAHNRTSIAQGYAACRKAEALLERLGNGLPDQEVYRLYYLWAGLAFQASDLEMASRLSAALLEEGQLRQSLLLIGCAYHLQAREALHTYQPALALERVRMALGSLESCNFPSELIRVYVTRARAYLYLDRMEDADCSLQAALTAGQSCTDPEDMYALADAEYSLGVSSAFRGFSDRAERLARSSLAKAEQVGYMSGISRARMVLVRSFFLQNRCEDALEEYWNTVKLLPRQLTPFSACILETTAARCYLTLGDIDRSIAVLRKATDISPALQSKEYYSDGFSVRGFMHLILLDSPTAILYHQKGLEFAHSFYWQMLNLYPLGIAQLETGQTKVGLENVSQAISRTRAANIPFLYQQAEILLATWMVRNGQVEAACEIERQISAEIDKNSLAVFPMRLIHLRALIALAQQDYARANSILENQVRLAQQNSMIWFEIFGYRLLDRAELAQGRPPVHQEEIKRLLSRLSIKCQDEEIRPVFERFRNIVQNPNEE